MNENFENTALIIVDMQADFMTGGSLQVGANGASEKLVPIISEIRPKYGYVVATQDWHPYSHCSFKENGGTWPAHCVAGTHGAQLNSELFPTLGASSPTGWVDGIGPKFADVVIQKGTEAGFEAYSGFSGTDLAERLRAQGITEVHVCGLATNFCVKATAFDAQKAGFKTVVLLFACEGVEIDALNIHVAPAIAELKAAGVELVH